MAHLPTRQRLKRECLLSQFANRPACFVALSDIAAEDAQTCNCRKYATLAFIMSRFIST
jgi:hypothetical protein